MNPRQLQAVWFSKRVASPLAEAVKEGLRSGNLVGEPKVGGYTVVPEGIVVEATVSVVVPPSKVLAEAPPKESLKLLFDTPSLLAEIPADRIKDIPFKALKGPQFSTFVKKMGGLGQYSDEILHALLEGRKKQGYEDEDDFIEIFWPLIRRGVDQYAIGDNPRMNDWGGGDDCTIQIKGGNITGNLFVPIEWENHTHGLTIKKDIPDSPYISLDSAIHGKGEKSTHPSLRSVRYEDPLRTTNWTSGKTDLDGRVEVLPKGTPGVLRVDVKRDWRMQKAPLTWLSRKNLETLVNWFAEA